MHTCGFAHLDLCLENITYSTADQQNLVQICDFGLSRKLNRNSDMLFAPPTRVFLDGIIVKIAYMAPELLDPNTTKGFSGPAADLWSCGVILLRLLGCSGQLWRAADPEVDVRFEGWITGSESKIFAVMPPLKRLSNQTMNIERQLMGPKPQARPAHVVDLLNSDWFEASENQETDHMVAKQSVLDLVVFLHQQLESVAAGHVPKGRVTSVIKYSILLCDL